jgi:hypothetical protein
MSEGCKVCGYPGGPDPGHLEYVHAVRLKFVRRLTEQEEKYKQTIAVLTGQKKNRMLLGLTREITRLREELAQARRGIEMRTERLREKVLGPQG